MPNYIKALIFILAATAIVMVLARDPLSSHYTKEEYRNYRNTWWFLTVCLFISPGIWIFYAIVILLLLTRRYATDIDRVVTYCFLLFAAPSIEAAIPGFAGINRLFVLDLQKILILIVLLPLFKKSISYGGISSRPSDKYVVLYTLLICLLMFRDPNFTNSARESLVLAVEVIIPYFVVSRTIKSLADFNKVLLALMFTLSLIAAEAVFEALKHWELYNSTGHRLIGERVFRFSGSRAGFLRARSIFLSPIILGLAMVFLLALLLYLKPFFTKKMAFYILVAICGIALIVCFSRAAWVGGVILFVVYVFVGSGFAKVVRVAMAGSLVGFFLLTMTTFGQRILNLIPFFGGTERSDTFDYRARLMENGIILIKRNPWFGDHFYLDTPEMEEMRQGQGIVDTVNAFLSIAMRNGLVGLFLFLMIFIPSMIIIYRSSKKLLSTEERFGQIGRMLVSYMVAAMFIMSTVANADFVKVIYFLVASLMAAWIGIYRQYEREGEISKELVKR